MTKVCFFVSLFKLTTRPRVNVTKILLLVVAMDRKQIMLAKWFDLANYYYVFVVSLCYYQSTNILWQDGVQLIRLILGQRHCYFHQFPHYCCHIERYRNRLHSLRSPILGIRRNVAENGIIWHCESISYFINVKFTWSSAQCHTERLLDSNRHGQRQHAERFFFDHYALD